jgi:hypothetical protein
VKIVVFRGRDTRGGKSVLLHQLTESNDHTDVLKPALRYLLGNSPASGGAILDLVEIQGAQFLVTEDRPECLALREWLDWELQGAKAAPSAPAPAATRDAGDFTRMFQKPFGTVVPAEQKPVAQASKPGEFTQLFEPPGHYRATEPPQRMDPPMPSAPTPLASESQPGEFTRLFRGPLASPSEFPSQPLPAAAPTQRTPGEFTRVFGGGTPIGPSTSSSTTSPPAPPQVAPSQPGFLTESLESRPAPLNSPAVAPVPAGPGEFTRVIRSPSPAAPVASPAPQTPPPSAAAPLPITMPVVPVAPAPHIPPPPQVPAVTFSTPQAAAPIGARTPMLAIVILFAILLLAALGLILFVILRR